MRKSNLAEQEIQYESILCVCRKKIWRFPFPFAKWTPTSPLPLISFPKPELIFQKNWSEGGDQQVQKSASVSFGRLCGQDRQPPNLSGLRQQRPSLLLLMEHLAAGQVICHRGPGEAAPSRGTLVSWPNHVLGLFPFRLACVTSTHVISVRADQMAREQLKGAQEKRDLNIYPKCKASAENDPGGRGSKYLMTL